MDDDQQAPDRRGSGEQKICGRKCGGAVGFAGGEHLSDVQHRKAAGKHDGWNGQRRGHRRNGCRRRDRTGGAVRMRVAGQQTGVSVLKGGEIHAARGDISEAAAPRRVLCRKAAHVRGGAGGGGGRGSAGNLLRRLPAAVFLCDARAADAVCRAVLREPALGGGAAGVCADDSRRDCGRTDLGKEAAEQILGPVHGAGRHLP